MAIKHAYTNPTTDLGVVGETGPDEWNAAHTVEDFDAPQAMFQSGDISPTQITASQDNYAPTGFSAASIVRLSSNAIWNITGIAAGADGRRVTLINVGSFAMALVHDATSTAGNRFYCPDSVDYRLGPHAAVDIWYDSTSSRWRIVASQGAWQAWTPTVSSTGGALTSAVGAGRYRLTGKTLQFTVTITITTDGPGSGILTFTLPGSLTPNGNQSFSGRGVSGTTVGLVGIASNGVNAAGLTLDTGLYPGADGFVLNASGMIEIT